MALSFVSKTGKKVSAAEASKALAPSPTTPAPAIIEKAMSFAVGAQVQSSGSQVQEAKPVTVETYAVKTEVMVHSATDETAALVDEYTSIQIHLDKLDVAQYVKRQEEIKKSLQLIAKSDQYDPNSAVILQGSHGNWVEFSACANSQVINDQPGLIDKLGQDVWNQVAKATITDLKKVLSENELAKFLKKVAGARTFKALVKGS